VIRKVDGLVLVGTYGSGAFVVVDGRPMRLPMDRQGFLTHVHAFARDGKGMLWMSTNRGLFRLAMADLHAWLRDPSHHVYYAYYGVDDGIRNAELNGGCDPSFLELGNGQLAFPSLEGVVVFDPAGLPDPVPSGQVRITDLYLDGSPMTVGGELVLPSGHGELRMKLSLPYWGSPENAHLQYRIKGMQTEWSTLGIKERELRFARFQPGDYELQVRVLGSEVEREPTLLRFRVEAPLHRRWWFLALAGVGSGLLLLTLLRLNERRLRRLNEELEQAVRARTHELQEANEQLHRSVELKERLVSIISHDIVTPLRFIARVARSMRGRASVIDEDLRDIAASSDKLHANARNILNWIKHQGGHIELRPRHVAMNPLVEDVLDTMREPATGQGVSLHNEVPMDDVLRTDSDVLHIILQNIVANAVNYAPEGSVTVQGTHEGAVYVLSVVDTGRGISPKALVHVRDILQGKHGRRGMDHGDPEMQGLGYVIIGELTGLLGGSVEVAPRESGGTQVTLRLPLRMDSTAQVPDAQLK
jgi:signal transduction histidine kinase